MEWLSFMDVGGKREVSITAQKGRSALFQEKDVVYLFKKISKGSLLYGYIDVIQIQQLRPEIQENTDVYEIKGIFHYHPRIKTNIPYYKGFRRFDYHAMLCDYTYTHKTIGRYYLCTTN